MGKRLRIEVVTGELAGQRFAVPAAGLRLGRSSSNDIHIPDAQLSRNHCLFEQTGEDGVRLTDLASANGTTLNGTLVGNDPVIIKHGDVIEVGTTQLRIIDENEPPQKPAETLPASIDLGLGQSPKVGAGREGSAGAPSRRRSPFANVLWAFVLLFGCAAIYVLLVTPRSEKPASVSSVPVETEPVLRELVYEKVEADAKRIFRYELRLSGDGVLSVAVDNVPSDNRHLTKSRKIDAKALRELNEILAFRILHELEHEYAGVEPDPLALESWNLRVVYSTRVQTIRIVNTQEPAAFRAAREKLEAFSKNELGVWALQYSREKLIELAEEALARAKAKWDDREVQYGNLYESIKAAEEAIFYLETVNPKPPCAVTAREGRERAKRELESRYSNQRFLADRAINLQQWETAKRELGILLELIPERTDDRYREASAKLVDVEKRLKGSK